MKTWAQRERNFIHSALADYYTEQKRSEDAARHLRALQDLSTLPNDQHQSDGAKSVAPGPDSGE